MFAILVVEREPTKLENLPAALQFWTITAGAIAAVALLIWGIAYLIRPPKHRDAKEGRLTPAWLIAIFALGALLAAVPYGLALAMNAAGWSVSADALGIERLKWIQKAGINLLIYLAACALIAVLAPVFRNFGRLRGRRIWALARLSFKEAVRRRVLWGFSAFLLVLLFASWFLPFKMEDQVRNYVRVMYWAMTPLLLVTAGLLAAFSIPADLKSQTMHTIVTKPVERFEIVLGRCLGYIMLMSLVLTVMTAFSLIYVARGIEPEAREESYKARVPIFGAMQIYEGKMLVPGISVGREWEYRKYISGGATNERAVWSFTGLPNVSGRDTIRLEFAFDIFRTTKGLENKGVFCSFFVENPKWDPKNYNAYKQERDQALDNPDPQILARARDENWDKDKVRAALQNAIAEKFGFYELASKEIADYHTMSIEVPAALFKDAAEAAKNTQRPPVLINVRCESPTQYLGVAKHDLYLLDDENAFEWNFFKGAAGLWFRICLVIVVAVTLSTYLSGIISFLTTMLLYVFGIFSEFIRTVAEGKNEGGGPLESLIRLSQGMNMMTPIDQSPTLRVAQGTDEVYRLFLRGVLSFIPSVERYDLTNYVAQGFDISASQLMWDNALPLAAYLLPCAVLGFYLMRSREIAA